MIGQQQQLQQAEQKNVKLKGGVPALKYTDPHAPTHTHTYHSTHTAQTRICNVHTHVGVVNTNLMCDCCCIPWLPQSRELLHQRRKTADIWIFRCRARLQLRGKRPRDNLPDFASLNALSTRLGAHPRPKLAPWFTGGPSACPQPGAAVQHSTAQYSTQYYTIVVQYSVQYSIAVQYSSTVQQYSTAVQYSSTVPYSVQY